MMRIISTTAAVCVMLLLANTAVAQKEDKSAEPLQGKWRVVDVRGGELGPNDKEATFEFMPDGKMKLSIPQVDSVNGGYRTKAAANGNEIDLIFPNPKDEGGPDVPEKSRTAIGLFKIEGNTLEIIVDRPGAPERPKAFNVEGGIDRRLIILKKAS